MSDPLKFPVPVTWPIPPDSDFGIPDGTAPFISNLWKLLSDPYYGHTIRWIRNGTAVIVAHNHPDFAFSTLPRFYRHSNPTSFLRQMNMYGFQRLPVIHLLEAFEMMEPGDRTEYFCVDRANDTAGFYHPNCQRESKELIASIRPKNTSTKKREASATSATTTSLSTALPANIAGDRKSSSSLKFGPDTESARLTYARGPNPPVPPPTQSSVPLYAPVPRYPHKSTASQPNIAGPSTSRNATSASPQTPSLYSPSHLSRSQLPGSSQSPFTPMTQTSVPYRFSANPNISNPQKSTVSGGSNVPPRGHGTVSPRGSSTMAMTPSSPATSSKDMANRRPSLQQHNRWAGTGMTPSPSTPSYPSTPSQRRSVDERSWSSGSQGTPLVGQLFLPPQPSASRALSPTSEFTKFWSDSLDSIMDTHQWEPGDKNRHDMFNIPPDLEMFTPMGFSTDDLLAFNSSPPFQEDSPSRMAEDETQTRETCKQPRDSQGNIYYFDGSQRR